MLTPSRFTTRSATFDFSSSGGDTFDVTELWAEEELLANAIEFIDWSNDPVQVRVCEKCGVTGCEPGGWLSLRSGGSTALLIPAFSRMAENPSEYAPPKNVARVGGLIISCSVYDSMRHLIPGLPHPDALPRLSCNEAALVLQASAPGRVLGKFPSPPRLEHSRVLASDPENVKEQIDALNSVLSTFTSSSANATVRPQSSDPVTLYLNLPGTPAWQPFVSSERFGLALAPGVEVVAA